MQSRAGRSTDPIQDLCVHRMEHAAGVRDCKSSDFTGLAFPMLAHSKSPSHVSETFEHIGNARPGQQKTHGDDEGHTAVFG